MASTDAFPFSCLYPNCPAIFQTEEDFSFHLASHQTLDLPSDDFERDFYDVFSLTDDSQDPQSTSDQRFTDDVSPDDFTRPQPHSTPPPLTADDRPEFFRERHPNLAKSIPGGSKNLFEAIEDDAFAKFRHQNPHFPLEDHVELGLVDWMEQASLTQRDIDAFLRLDYVRQNPLSFHSARDLRAKMESFPNVPRWKHQRIVWDGYKTKSPMHFFWRDGLEVARYLFSNPIFATCMETNAYRLFTGRECLPSQRVYGEFMSGNFAWDYQSKMNEGETMIGIIIASDKTQLTTGTGSKDAYPLYLSIANIHAAVRMKATSRAFVLIGYIPVTTFLNVTDHEQSVLRAQLYHFCLTTATTNLHYADSVAGVNFADPWGGLRIGRTPLVAAMTDLPEQQLISCTTDLPVIATPRNQFGELPTDAPVFRTREHILHNIKVARTTASSTPSLNEIAAGGALEPWWKACNQLHLNGVDKPFWENWGNACPSQFLTHDALHGFHKFFMDHMVAWAINIMGGTELDKRLAALQHRPGVRKWPNGVSKTRQLTGRDYRELQKVFIGVIADALPDDVISALRALLDFIFQAQSLYVYDETLAALRDHFREFHHYKKSITDHHGRIGSRNRSMDHFRIPKLEMFRIVEFCIMLVGALYQHSTETSERCHKTLVKAAYRMSNFINYHEQCARWMDRVEKLNLFRIYTTLKANNAPLYNIMLEEDDHLMIQYPEYAWLSRIIPEGSNNPILQRRPRFTNLFHQENALVIGDTAMTLAVQPQIKNTSVDTIAETYHLPHLGTLLAMYIQTYYYEHDPLTGLHAWNSLRLQHHSVQDPRRVNPAYTVQALPPSDELPFGRCHTVLVQLPDHHDDFRVTGGLRVIQIRLILQPIFGQTVADAVVYGQTFSFSPLPEHVIVTSDGTYYVPSKPTDMFLLHRDYDTLGNHCSGIFPLSSIVRGVHLIPRFGARIGDGIDSNNSMELIDEFYMNNYDSKETYHAVLSYQ